MDLWPSSGFSQEFPAKQQKSTFHLRTSWRFNHHVSWRFPLSDQCLFDIPSPWVATATRPTYTRGCRRCRHGRDLWRRWCCIFTSWIPRRSACRDGCCVCSFWWWRRKRRRKQNTLLRVIPTMTFIHFVTGKSSGILSDIFSGIRSGILSGISSGILPGISSGRCSGISSGRCSGLSSGISSGICSGISFWHSIWHIFWHIIWQIFWHSIWHSI